MSEKIVRGVSCPACGGSLELEEGTIVLQCNFCNIGLLVKGDRGIPRFYVPVKYDRDAVQQRIQKWFRSFRIAPGLRKEAQFHDFFLVYLPFWHVSAGVLGWILGQRKKGSGKNASYVEVEVEINQPYDMTHPACDVGELGVKWVDLTGDEIRPFDLEEVQKQGMTFGILNTPTDIVPLSHEKFLEWAKDSAKVDRVSFSRMNLIQKKLSIVYYPLWVARYAYKDRLYQVTVDAESSDILYGRAPGNNFFRAVVFLIALMIGNFWITSGIRQGSEGKVYILLISLAIIAFGYFQYRYGGEVRKEQVSKLGGLSLANLGISKTGQFSASDVAAMVQSLIKK